MPILFHPSGLGCGGLESGDATLKLIALTLVSDAPADFDRCEDRTETFYAVPQKAALGPAGKLCILRFVSCVDSPEQKIIPDNADSNEWVFSGSVRSSATSFRILNDDHPQSHTFQCPAGKPWLMLIQGRLVPEGWYHIINRRESVIPR